MSFFKTIRNAFCYKTELFTCYELLYMSIYFIGLKLAVTGPHFYLAHKYVTERVTGLNPKREEHETYVDIEPVSKNLYLILMKHTCVHYISSIKHEQIM